MNPSISLVINANNRATATLSGIVSVGAKVDVSISGLPTDIPFWGEDDDFVGAAFRLRIVDECGHDLARYPLAKEDAWNGGAGDYTASSVLELDTDALRNFFDGVPFNETREFGVIIDSVVDAAQYATGRIKIRQWATASTEDPTVLPDWRETLADLKDALGKIDASKEAAAENARTASAAAENAARAQKVATASATTAGSAANAAVASAETASAAKDSAAASANAAKDSAAEAKSAQENAAASADTAKTAAGTAQSSATAAASSASSAAENARTASAAAENATTQAKNAASSASSAAASAEELKDTKEYVDKVLLTKVFPAEKNEETGEYEVSVKSVFKNKVTIEPGTGDETAEEEETADSVGIAAFDNSVERGLEVFDESAAISSKLVPDGTAFATCGAIREVAYKFPTFSSSDTVNTIITKLQQIITLLQEIGD